MLYNVGGNFAIQSSDSDKVRKALKKADFVISHDFFMTPTCQWSGIVFPVAMFPERRDICTANASLVFYSEQGIEPREGDLTDYQIFTCLAERLGFGECFTGGCTADEWLDRTLEESPIVDQEGFKKTGIWEGPSRMHVGFSDYIKDPEKNPLDTPSGRIELTPDSYIAAGGQPVPDLSVSAITSDTFPLYLITPRGKFRIHSQNNEIASLARLFDDRLLMNPQDADGRGIHMGDNVKVCSETGFVVLEVNVTDSVMPGVVCMKTGHWETVTREDGNRFSGANTLTSDIWTKPSTGSRTHSNAVEVLRV